MLARVPRVHLRALNETKRCDMGVSENRGTLFGGPYNKDPNISGTILVIRAPYFRKIPHDAVSWFLIFRPGLRRYLGNSKNMRTVLLLPSAVPKCLDSRK